MSQGDFPRISSCSELPIKRRSLLSIARWSAFCWPTPTHESRHDAGRPGMAWSRICPLLRTEHLVPEALGRTKIPHHINQELNSPGGYGGWVKRSGLREAPDLHDCHGEPRTVPYRSGKTMCLHLSCLAAERIHTNVRLIWLYSMSEYLS